jgi:hypothetical protein
MSKQHPRSPQWSIRNVAPEARDMVLEVMEVSAISAGEAVTQAIEFWYDSLPEADEEIEHIHAK